MSSRGLYIGIPNGVVFCVDGWEKYGIFHARMFHGYRTDALDIRSFEELIFEMGRLFDDIQFPRASVRERRFIEENMTPIPGRIRKERIMSDKNLLAQHGDIGTFIIRVQQRQNSTWQGRITWVEEDKTLHFRSLLEMIKLIESGIIAENPQYAEVEPPTWENEEQ